MSSWRRYHENIWVSFSNENELFKGTAIKRKRGDRGLESELGRKWKECRPIEWENMNRFHLALRSLRKRVGRGCRRHRCQSSGATMRCDSSLSVTFSCVTKTLFLMSRPVKRNGQGPVPQAIHIGYYSYSF